MKNVYLVLICSVFSIVLLFPGTYATCQSYSSLNYTEGAAPPIPTLYSSAQNIDDIKSLFGSVTSVGNTLYIPVIKTLVPADSTLISLDAASQSTERDYVIRAFDFSDPYNPAHIHDMDIDIDIDRYPQLFLCISDNYIYAFNGEMDMWGDYSPKDSSYEAGPSVKANFTIYEIRNNHDIIKIKDLPLTNILDTIRGDQDGLLQAQLLTVTDDRAYLIFCSFGPDDSMTSFYTSYTPEVLPGSYPTGAIDNYSDEGYMPVYTSSSSEVLPGSYPTVQIDAYSDEGYVPVDASYSYTPWKPKNNTLIVTIDIKDPSNATILGASRPNIATTGANSALEVSGDIGYFIAAPLDSKDTSLYVVDLSSPENSTILNTLTIYGQGGQMARQGNYLYIAANDFGLEVVDISDPLNPQLTGWLETPHPIRGMYGSTMGGENNIVVKNDYVYMIEREDGLLTINVSDPSNPQLIGNYLSDYIADSSEPYFYAPYTSVDNAGDYLFLREMGALDILSIITPDDPVSVGIFGVRDASILMLALTLESAGLVKITTEVTPEGEIALFGIASLDTLSRKYGVGEIIPANEYQQYYMPYMSYPPDETEPSVEEIEKDRDLRTYYLSFPAAVNQDEIIADYLVNPYVITAEFGLPEVFGPYGYSGGPYYSIQESQPSLYGGMYGGLYGGVGMYGGIYGAPYGASLYGSGVYGSSLYGGSYEGSLYGSIYGAQYPFSGSLYGSSLYGNGLYGGGMYGGIYGSLYSGSYSGGPYSGQIYGGGLYGGLYGSGSMYGGIYGAPYSGSLYGGPGMTTSYPITTYPTTPVQGFYGGYGYGLSGIYGGLMPSISAPTTAPEPLIQIGTITIEGGVHIGELHIENKSSPAPELSLAIIPDIDSLMDSPQNSADNSASSQESEVSPSSDSLDDSLNRQMDTNWSNTAPWLSNQKKSSFLWLNDLLKSSSSPVKRDLWLW